MNGIEERYISLLTDFGFKRIFGTAPNKDLLINFLNSLFDGRKVIKSLKYEDSLKTYRDLKNSLDTAEEKGRNEGRDEGRDEEKKATIRRLLASGASVDIISIATGLSEADVRLLIDEISKE